MKKPFFKIFVAILTILSGIILVSMTRKNTNAVAEQKPVLIQLFTSQGCSSCPPADRLLKEMAEKYAEDEVHVLSYHVDYWDRLGWKDPFSQKAFTEKQYAYAKIFNLNTVYTPQAVVNGQYEFVGSNRTKMENAIQNYAADPNNAKISLKTARDGKNVTISYEAISMQAGDKLTFSLYITEKNTAVARGENRGAQLLSKNIVITEKQTTASQGTIAIQIPENHKDENLGIMAYVQNAEQTVTTVTDKKFNQK